jgi:hypothetical protein
MNHELFNMKKRSRVAWWLTLPGERKKRAKKVLSLFLMFFGTLTLSYFYPQDRISYKMYVQKAIAKIFITRTR